MNTYVWSKTILSIYPYLSGIADAIDKVVERRAINSFYVSSVDCGKNDTLSVVNKLIELADRKIVLINLKVLVDKCLRSIDRTMAKVLIAKYISRKKGKDGSLFLGIPERTYYRKVKEGEAAFGEELKKQGYDDKKLEEFLKGEEWIFEIKEGFEKEKEVLFNSNFIKKKVAI